MIPKSEDNANYLLMYFSGRDASGTRGGHSRESESYDKSNSTGRRGGYQGKNSRSDNDREDRKVGRRGGFKNSGKAGNRDSNYDGGKASTSDDHQQETNSSSRINGQTAKNGPVTAGNVDGKGALSGVEDSGLSSLSSSDCNKSGPSATSNDSKVIFQKESFLVCAALFKSLNSKK